MPETLQKEIHRLDRGLLTSGLVIVIFFFFSSWFSLNLEGAPIDIRGFQIGLLAGWFLEGSVRERWILRLIQFLPLFSACLSGMFLWGKSSDKRRLLRIIAVVSMISMVYLINLKSKVGTLSEPTTVQWGMFAVFVGVVCMLCGSLYSLRDGALDG
ncbi:hypothetical protein ACFLT7_00855 [candidate division KSB1 bacterium]